MSPQQHAANIANSQLSSGPRTPAGLARSSHNSLRHGLTAKTVAPCEAEEFNAYHAVMFEALAPSGTREIELAEAIVFDKFRLQRARSLDSQIFAIGRARSEWPEKLADGETFMKEGKSLALLTLYEQRINRTLARNTEAFDAMQATRQAAHAQAVQEAMLLTELAESKGEVYDPEPDFPNPEDHGGFVYSTPVISRLISRSNRLGAAQTLRTSPEIRPRPARQAA